MGQVSQKKRYSVLFSLCLVSFLIRLNWQWSVQEFCGLTPDGASRRSGTIASRATSETHCKRTNHSELSRVTDIIWLSVLDFQLICLLYKINVNKKICKKLPSFLPSGCCLRVIIAKPYCFAWLPFPFSRPALLDQLYAGKTRTSNPIPVVKLLSSATQSRVSFQRPSCNVWSPE